MGRTWRKDLVSAGVVIVVTAIAFWPVRSAQFINWDDLEYFAQNPNLNPPRLAQMIEYIRGPYMGSVYPVAYWYIGAVAAIARTDQPDARGVRLDPRVFHVGNVVLHALIAIAV